MHFNDPNAFVERVRLLLHTLSGHSNHINEINSIVEELKEAYIV